MNDVLSQFVSSSPSIVSSIQQMDSDLSSAQAQVFSLQQQVLSLSSLVFDHLENSPWLVAGGTAANTGSVGNTADSSQSQPSALSASFSIKPNGPYADKYWYKQFGPHPEVVSFVQEGSFLFPTLTDSNSSQAVEFDLQQVIKGKVFNMGWQFDYAEGLLRYWNRSVGDWEPTGVALTRQAPGTWVQCSFSTHRDSSAIYYDSATINGVVQPIKQISFPAPLMSLTDMLNFGFQLDGNKMAAPYSVTIDNFRLTGKII